MLHFSTGTVHCTVHQGCQRSLVLQAPCCYTSLHSTVQYVQGTGGRRYFRVNAATLHYTVQYSTSRVPEVVGTTGAMLLHFTGREHSTVLHGYRMSRVLQGPCCYTLNVKNTVQYFMGSGGRAQCSATLLHYLSIYFDVSCIFFVYLQLILSESNSVLFLYTSELDITINMLNFTLSKLQN